MNRILRIYLPGVSISFMIIMLLSCGINYVQGNTFDGFVPYVFEVAAYLIVASIVDALTGLIDFKSYLSYFLTETMILYPITLLFGILGHWFGARIGAIATATILYLCIMAVVHYYFYSMSKREADKINDYIQKK